jgi:hypothetical protein
MPPEVKAASKWLLSLTTYTGLVVAVWALPWSASAKATVLGVFILIAVMVVVLAKTGATRREIKALKLEKEALERQISDADYASDLENGMIALAHALTQLPTDDSQNHFYEVEESYRIDGNDATYKYTLRGVRVAEGSADYLAFKVSGDSPADASTLLAEAVDLTTGDPLSIAFLRDDLYFKVIQVIFRPPLAKSDTFKIEITLRWSGTFPRTRRRDYLFSTWSQFASLGIDRLTCKLSSDLELKNVVLEELRDGRRQRSDTQPKIISAHGRCDVTWVSTSPGALYLLQFEKVYH